VDSGRKENGRFVKLERPSRLVAFSFGEKALDEVFSLLSHFRFASEGNQLHRPVLSAVIEDLAVNVNLRVILKLFHELLGLFEGVFEGVGVGPREVGSVRLGVEVVEVVRETDAETVLGMVVPLEHTLLPLPLHRVGRDAINWPQAHLVELSLRCHATDVESQRVPALNALHAEVEPRVEMSFGRIGQAVA
jgi:hypothetical protein